MYISFIYYSLSVRLGEFDESTDPDCRNVRGRFTCTSVLNVAPEQVFVHESFSPRSFSYDIALIKLARDVEFSGWLNLSVLLQLILTIFVSTESISPICLPVTEELQKAEMYEYTLIGWGTNPVVTEATVSYINNTECAKSYPELTSHQMCTSTPNDLCRGTAGSPLFNVNVYNDLQRRVQFGIVSYGKASCEDGVYTEVSSFIPWIALKVGTHAG